MRVLVSGLALALLLCSCSPGSSGKPPSTPESVSAKAVVLQSNDVPVMERCPQSDMFAALLLKGQPEMLPTGMSSWSTLKAGGATDGWMSLYADDVVECPYILGVALPKGRLVYAAAIKFRDSSSAAADFASDSRNFPVAPDFADRFAAAGGKVVKGASTGFGDNSVLATVSLSGVPRYVVFWQNKNFEGVVYASNVSPTEGTLAATNMNGRIH